MKSGWLRVAVLLAILPAAGACSGDDNRGSPDDVPSFTETACEVNASGLDSGQLRCGFVSVPEDRAEPGGRKGELAVVVARSAAPSPAPDPIVILSGGPGDALIDSYLPYLQRIGAVSALLERRDVVLFDQRGTGRSRPLLDCPEYEEATSATLMFDQSALEDSQEIVAALRVCHDRLIARGEDLTAYTSAASAQDVRDVMTALGYEQWNLYGVSYGARLAQTALRDAPEGIRSAILDSVVPVAKDLVAEFGRNFEHSLTVLFETCAADARCEAAFPDLESDLFALLERFEAAPLTVSAVSPDTGEEVTIVVTGERLLLGLHSALYDAELISVLPLLISLTASGDTGLLAAAAADIATGPLVAEAMNNSVECGEEAPFLTPEVLADGAAGVRAEIQAIADDVVVRQTLDTCSFWSAAAPSPLENEPVVSDVPTLVLAGALDPITPTYYSRGVADLLPRGRYFEFRGFGHGVLGTASTETAMPRCAARLINSFLDDPTGPLDESCVAALPPIRFAGS
jgi:pimeloyl-ACP methyl ester carboxylesterase